MFNHYLQSIEGIGIYPLISLLVFFIFFVVMLIWIFKADKNHLREMSILPLDENDNSKINFSGDSNDD